jgi:GNAT superfamily N-acetyltransferase
MATPLPLGWHTDVAVLAYSGSEVEEHAGHLVVRTRANPTYHWGNFVLVTDPDAVGEAGRWLGVFEAAFPDARHRAIGLCADPPDASAWESLGLEVEHEDVLAGQGPRRTPLANGYVVRPLEAASDWEQDVRLSMGTDRDPAQDVFQRGATAAKARMCAAGVAVFLGAFEGPDLVADLGIVDCGEGIARYQSVVTAEPHRRRGLASHLLGVAADWAHARACDRLVILADADGAPSHLYRSLGFSPVLRSAQAYSRETPSVVAD